MDGSTNNSITYISSVTTRIPCLRPCRSPPRRRRRRRRLLDAIGVDSTTVASGVGGAVVVGLNNYLLTAIGSYAGFPGLGKHVLQALEGWDGAAGGCSFFGSDTVYLMQLSAQLRY